MVHGYFDRNGAGPVWLHELGALSGYVQPPTFHKFRIHDKATNIILTGSPDAVFKRLSGGHVIGDYKTAYPDHDQLMPMYAIQLNVYAAIGEQCGLSPVEELALIYTTPLTDVYAASLSENHRCNGFAMGFEVTVKRLAFQHEAITVFLEVARQVYDMASPPSGHPQCKDCKYLNDLMNLVIQFDAASASNQGNILRAFAAAVDSPLAGVRLGGIWLPFDDDRPGPWPDFMISNPGLNLN